MYACQMAKRNEITWKPKAKHTPESKTKDVQHSTNGTSNLERSYSQALSGSRSKFSPSSRSKVYPQHSVLKKSESATSKVSGRKQHSKDMKSQSSFTRTNHSKKQSVSQETSTSSSPDSEVHSEVLN